MRRAAPRAASAGAGASIATSAAPSRDHNAEAPRRGAFNARPLAVGSVGDDPDVDPGSSRTSAREQRAAKDLAPAALVGRAHEDVRRAALVDDAPHHVHEIVAFLFDEVRPEDHGEAAQRGERHVLLLAQLPAGRTHPDCVHLRSETLGRAPCAPHDPLRLRLRLDEGEHTLGDRLLAERVENDCLAPRPDVLRHLAQRELAERGELVAAEEVLQRRLGALARVDLPGPDALLQRFRRQVDEHDLVRLLEHLVGERLAHTDVGELEDRVVEALEVLDVDGRDRRRCRRRGPRRCPASASRSACPGAFVCASSSTSASSGARRIDRVDVHLLELEPAVLGAQARRRPRALRRARRSRAGRAARDSRSRRRDRPLPPAGPPGACGTSCRRLRPSRAGSDSGRAHDPS